MKSVRLIIAGLFLAHLVLLGAAAAAQTGNWAACTDRASQQAWIDHHLGDKAVEPFFSMLYDGKPVAETMRTWHRTYEVRSLDEHRTQITVTWRDPTTKLAVRCEAVEFRDFPAVEWTLHLTNEGQAATPILSDIRPLAISVAATPAEPCALHYAKGGVAALDDFAPQQHGLELSSRFELGSAGGRSSNGVLPFFNVQAGGRGLIEAVGWTGNWKAQFDRRDDGWLLLAAGMRRTCLKLLPGESIRTPQILLLFWQGDRLESQNLLRRFLTAHHGPLPKATAGRLPIFYGAWGEVYEATHLRSIQWLADNKVPIDVYWIDAGWYGDKPFQENSTDANSEWWKYTGSWRPNKITYPRGLKPIGDMLHRHDLGFLLWIESERAFRGTDLTRQHPEWLLGPQGDNYLVNLGDPAARKGIMEIVSALVREGGLAWYRQDFNTDPENFWSHADAPDRAGMSEIRYIEGLYAFWDELRQRHPGLLIDNCASGGRRLDLETISRSVALWRSDFQCKPKFNPAGMQGQTYGISSWIPLSAGVVQSADPYRYSGLSAGIILSAPLEHAPELKALLEQVRQLQPYFLGDYYPLTPYSVADGDWLATQFNRPEQADGVVFAYRRPACGEKSLRLKLHGLDPTARYEVRSLDAPAASVIGGKSLLDEGLKVELESKPAAAVIRYQRTERTVQR